MDAAVKAWLSKGSRFAMLAAAIVALTLVGSAYISRDESGLESPARALAPGLVKLDAPDGTRLLFDSEAHAAFLPIISHFETQKSPAHCGIASIVMVLNALEFPRRSRRVGSYRLFTQDNVLSGLTDGIVSDRAVARRGMAPR